MRQNHIAVEDAVQQVNRFKSTQSSDRSLEADLPTGITWSLNLEIGIPALDRDHREFFDLLKRFLAAMEAGKAEAQVAASLAALRRHTVAHFEREEPIMRQSGYPGLGDHAAAHRAVTERVANYQRLFDQGGATSALVIEMSAVLADFLTTHIAAEDRQIAQFVAHAVAVRSPA